MNKLIREQIKDKVVNAIRQAGKGCFVGCDINDRIYDKVRDEAKRLLESGETDVNKFVDRIFAVIGDIVPSNLYKDIDIWNVHEVNNLGNIVSIKFSRGQDIKEVKMTVYEIIKLLSKLCDIISKAKEINLWSRFLGGNLWNSG